MQSTVSSPQLSPDALPVDQQQAVWDLVSDVQRYPQIGNIAEEVVLLDEGVLGKGSVYSETGRIAGMKSTNEGSRAGVARFGYCRPAIADP